MYSQWLKEQFDRNPEKKKAKLAKALGLEPPAISKILKGMRQIKAHELAIIKHFFDISNDDSVSIDPHSGMYVYTVETQPIQHNLHDSRHDHEDTGQWNIPGAINQTNPSKNQAILEDVIIYKNSDSAMMPDFKNGESVLVAPSDQTLPGIFMISDGYSTVIRYCEHIEENDQTALKISANSESFIAQIADLDDFKILGRVIGKIMML